MPHSLSSASNAIARPLASTLRLLLLTGTSVIGLRSASAQQACPPGPTHIEIANGTFGSQPGVSFQLRHFTANMVPLGRTAPLCFQKMTVVSHAEIYISNDSLTRIFSAKLGATDSKIKGLKIENGLNKVTLSGEIVKVIPLKFSVEGPVTTDGKSLLLNATKINADGIPIKALLGLLGDQLSSVMGFQGVNGVSVDGNTMSFFPEQIAHLKGHITGVDSSEQGLTLHYGRATAPRRKLAVSHGPQPTPAPPVVPAT